MELRSVRPGSQYRCCGSHAQWRSAATVIDPQSIRSRALRCFARQCGQTLLRSSAVSGARCVPPFAPTAFPLMACRMSYATWRVARHVFGCNVQVRRRCTSRRSSAMQLSSIGSCARVGLEALHPVAVAYPCTLSSPSYSSLRVPKVPLLPCCGTALRVPTVPLPPCCGTALRVPTVPRRC